MCNDHPNRQLAAPPPNYRTDILVETANPDMPRAIAAVVAIAGEQLPPAAELLHEAGVDAEEIAQRRAAGAWR